MEDFDESSVDNSVDSSVDAEKGIKSLRKDNMAMLDHSSLYKPKQKCCTNPLGKILRYLSSANSTYMDFFSLLSTLILIKKMPWWSKFLVTVPVGGIGSAYPNFGFWGKSIESNTGRMSNFVLKKCCHKTADNIPVVSQGDKPPEKACTKTCKKGAIYVVGPFSIVNNWASSTFVVREALVEVMSLRTATDGIFYGALFGPGLVSALYFIATELLSLKQDIDGSNDDEQQQNEVVRYLLLRYLMGIIGPLNESGLVYGLPLYVQLNNMTKTPAVAGVFTGLIALSSAVITFYFRSGILLKNTPLMKYLNARVENLSKRVRFGGMCATGAISLITSFSQYEFAAEQIFTDVYVDPEGFNRQIDYGTIVGVSCAQAAIGTAADMASEFAETYIQVMKLDDDDTEQATIESQLAHVKPRVL